MSYEPRGFSYLAKSYNSRLARTSAEHLRRITEHYTNEEKWVRDFRATAGKLDDEASKLEKELKKESK